MTTRTTNKFSPEVRERAMRMALEHAGDYPHRWAAMLIAAKIGCAAQTPRDWTKKVEVDSGKRAGVPSEVVEKLRALERENRAAAGQRDPAQGQRVFCLGGARPPPLRFPTILRIAGTLRLAPPTEARIAFIDGHREAYGVEPICKVLPIAASTYHEHGARRADPSRLPCPRRDAELQTAIRRVFDENHGVHGVRKV